MDQLQIQISNENFKNAYDFVLRCPLELALKEKYPKAYIIVGTNKVTFIEHPETDKEATFYSIPNEYNVKQVEESIRLAQSGGVAIHNLILTKIGTHENYLLTTPQDDHVDKLSLPEDL